MKFVFQAAAKTEFIEAIAWYESQRPGLGREFVLETGRALKLAWQNPELFRKVRGKARKIRLRRFSYYSIYFALQGDVFQCAFGISWITPPKRIAETVLNWLLIHTGWP